MPAGQYLLSPCPLQGAMASKPVSGEADLFLCVQLKNPKKKKKEEEEEEELQNWIIWQEI